jgi:hypothetical protein
VAVISHGFWMRRFGGSPQALERWVQIENRRFQIVGVAPQAFNTLEEIARSSNGFRFTESSGDQGDPLAFTPYL